MRNCELLPSQKASLFEAIKNAELNPADFHWQRTESNRHTNPCVLSKLVHTSSEYYYLFDQSDQSVWAERSPGENVRIERWQPGHWTTQLSEAKRWLEFLKREIETPDLWATVSQEGRVIEAASSDSANTPFSSEEKAYILSGLTEIKQYLLTAHKIDPELVESRLKYLAEASDRLGRKDWINILLSTIISIVIGAALPSETVREIFRFVATALQSILKNHHLLIT